MSETATERDARLRVLYAKQQAARVAEARQARSLAEANRIAALAARQAAEPTNEGDDEPSYNPTLEEPEKPPEPMRTPLGFTTTISVANFPTPIYIAGLDRVVTISILPLSTNAGSYVTVGGPSITSTSGAQVLKSATVPLVLENVRIGDLYIAGSAGDGVSWTAS